MYSSVMGKSGLSKVREVRIFGLRNTKLLVRSEFRIYFID